MMRAVLADTGPLYAAVDPDDARHKQSLNESGQTCRRERWQVAVAYPTLLEAYSLVLFKSGRQTASAGSARWLTRRLVNPDAEDYRKAVHAGCGHSPIRTITLFDGTVAALAERLGFAVWTYDHHFDVMRMGVWRC